MYRVLESRIIEKGIDKKQMAADINIEYDILLEKLSGKLKFTLDEAIIIKEYLKEEVAIEELFENN